MTISAFKAPLGVKLLSSRCGARLVTSLWLSILAMKKKKFDRAKASHHLSASASILAAKAVYPAHIENGPTVRKTNVLLDYLFRRVTRVKTSAAPMETLLLANH